MHSCMLSSIFLLLCPFILPWEDCVCLLHMLHCCCLCLLASCNKKLSTPVHSDVTFTWRMAHTLCLLHISICAFGAAARARRRRAALAHASTPLGLSCNICPRRVGGLTLRRCCFLLQAKRALRRAADVLARGRGTACACASRSLQTLCQADIYAVLAVGQRGGAAYRSASLSLVLVLNWWLVSQYFVLPFSLRFALRFLQAPLPVSPTLP